MIFETRLRGNPYICHCVTWRGLPGFVLIDLKNKPIDFIPTSQEIVWLEEEAAIAHYAQQRGIHY